eukprot:6634549-Lingulodinium_polyedra.AAC.1
MASPKSSCARGRVAPSSGRIVSGPIVSTPNRNPATGSSRGSVLPQHGIKDSMQLRLGEPSGARAVSHYPDIVSREKGGVK